MSEALNKNMEKNIFPHWRNHQSMKGWCSMNYPSVLTNPTIRRPTLKPRIPPSEQMDGPSKLNNVILTHLEFSNLNRPVSAPGVKINRPFTNRVSIQAVKLEPIQPCIGNPVEEKQLLQVATQNILNRQDSSMNDSSSNAGGSEKRSFVEHPIKEMRAVSQIQY